MLDRELLGAAASLGYYAMLYTARAALSEENLSARTHRGVWRLFRERFAETGRVDAALVKEAQDAQRLREEADYEAAEPTAAEAQALIRTAQALLEAVERTL